MPSRKRGLVDGLPMLAWALCLQAVCMLAVLTFAPPAAAQADNTAQANIIQGNPLQSVTDAFMKNVAAGDFNAAYALLAKYAVVPAADVQAALAQTLARRKQKRFTQTYGKTTGVVFVGRRQVANDLVRLTYIERGQRLPLVWTFVGYRTAVGWAITSFGWSPDTSRLFQY